MNNTPLQSNAKNIAGTAQNGFNLGSSLLQSTRSGRNGGERIMQIIPAILSMFM